MKAKIIISDLLQEEGISPQPTIEEQILAENQYQTALLEMNMMGAM